MNIATSESRFRHAGAELKLLMCPSLVYKSGEVCNLEAIQVHLGAATLLGVREVRQSSGSPFLSNVPLSAVNVQPVTRTLLGADTSQWTVLARTPEKVQVSSTGLATTSALAESGSP